ncbi:MULTISPECIES: TlpA family protein disulfide reductase [Sphingobacterium]|uniref:TlpA family protein disulfide reductase n=1 Tax=Sphingobacterium TaxID=28453 RepID=UPI0009E06921|nr:MULTISPECIES: TlpA disulfide reductase family protein [Sphingobacterium]MDH5827773.1 TlpA disulfide reductase family protein [Sphingobacterium faecium]
MKYLKLMALLCLMLMTILFVNAQSDKKIDFSKALKVGDTFVPPNAVQQMRGIGKVDLKNLGNKVVILDFFDTFCGTCIETMPKLQKLQDKLKDKVQIITVGWQDKETLEKFFDKNEFLKENKVNLPVIYSDLYLKERFPHLTVPHVVFLYKGKVQAISGNKVVTEEHILALYDKGEIELPLKDDFGKGNLMGLSRSEMEVKGAISFSGYQNGVPFESFRRKLDSVSGLQKTSFYNVSVYSAVLFNWAKIQKANYVPRPERLVLKVKDSNRYQDTANIGDVWYAQYAISYERLDEIQRTDSAQARIVLQDLHSFLGIRTYKTMKNIECLILKPCPVKPYTGKVPLNGMTFKGSSVLAVMLDMGRKFPPALDLAKSKVDIKLGRYSNLEELNERLANYGIVAEIGMGEQEVLVIEELE